MSKIPETVLMKLRALLALADRERNPNPNEAAAAMRKVEELRRKYNLEMAEIAGSGGDGDPVDLVVVEKGRQTIWKRVIARACAALYSCEVLAFHHGKGMVFAGARSDLDVAIEVFVYLVNAALSGSVRLGLNRSSRSVGDMRCVREDFLKGFAFAIQERVAAEIERRKAEDAAAAGDAGDRAWALIVRKKEATVADWLNKRLGLDEKPGKVGKVKCRTSGALAMGHAAGAGVDLGAVERRKMEEGGATSARRIEA